MEERQPSAQIDILDVRVDNVDLPGALERISSWLSDAESELRHVVTVNPEFVIAARRDTVFMDALQRSSLATADGIGIKMAARILSLPVPVRVTGVDLVEGLAASSLPNCRVFLLGAAEGVAAGAADALTRRFPDLQIAGTFAGGPSEHDFSQIDERLAESKPTVLLVAFGHPAQDLWIDSNRERLSMHGILVAVGVGGTFDYLSGRVPRAPRLIRRLGLEWLYRLIRQPWRWRRQLALPLFVMLVVRERFRQRHRNNPETS
jgi:N-acetylglucosaminyldiphosphoundecaprenol N-acetyl-beta-D-mannosaminyltransferase